VRQRGLAAVYSVLLLLTFGLGFNAVQSYVVATSLAESFGVATWATGAVMVLVLGSVIFGGIRRIALVSEVIVPIMALMYFLAALVVIALHITEVPAALWSIVQSAFGIEQAVGGGLGAVILQGVKRGLFSNEAGLGSAPNVAAVAHVPHPANQGVVQAFSVFIDTMIMCSCTAVIILLSDVYQPGAPDVDGVLLTQLAMGSHVGDWGATFVSVALVLFAFSSILYNYYLGDNSLSYFSDDNPTVANIFRVAVLGLVFWGSLQDLSTVFGFAELTMGLLALVNLVGLVWMYRIGMRLLRDYDTQLRQGEEPRLRPGDWRDLDIDEKSWPG
ncbi:MAG TPA: sodium:alanine symporter, partial [Halieaceae bacterium]|nr:sodium:alanine symporter [Halieaceae bacterium]